MPLYTSRKTSLHPSELNSQVEQPSKPQVWAITPCGTKSHAAPMLCLSTTMAIRTMMAQHDTTLPTPFLPPTASGSTPWQHNHIKISTEMVWTGASQQHEMQYGKQTPNDELQPPVPMPHDTLKHPRHTEHHSHSQCQVLGGKLKHPTNITQTGTPTPNLTHVDTMTPFYTKTSEKDTLLLSHKKSNHYHNTDITHAATATINSTTIAYHDHTHPCTPIATTWPIHPPTDITTTTASLVSCTPIHTSDTLIHIANQLRQQNISLQSDSPMHWQLPMATYLKTHALATHNDCTDMRHNSLPHNTPLSHNDNWVHQNQSHYTLTGNDTSNQPLPSENNHRLPVPMMLQQFDETFQTMQQQIQEQHFILKAKIQSFLAFLKQNHDNTLQTVLPPPARNSMIDASYLHPAIFKYFCEVYCSPMLPDNHWQHHCTQQLNSQHLTTCIFYSTNSRTDDDHPTVPPLNMTRSVPWSIITAPTKPPFYNDTFSKGKWSWPLTGPMITYCPPWLPPHQKCWYSANVDLNLQRSQPTSYTTTQYYQCNTTTSITAHNSYPVPPAPTASKKNLLRPP